MLSATLLSLIVTFVVTFVLSHRFYTSVTNLRWTLRRRVMYLKYDLPHYAWKIGHWWRWRVVSRSRRLWLDVKFSRVGYAVRYRRLRSY